MNKSLVAASIVCLAGLVGCGSVEKHADGTTEESIAVANVPAVVLEGFKKAYPGAVIEEVEKETYADGTVHYEIEFKDKDGVEQEVEFNDAGEVLERHH
jgi:hypothetical protein